eukprot:gene5805-143_t
MPSRSGPAPRGGSGSSKAVPHRSKRAPTCGARPALGDRQRAGVQQQKRGLSAAGATRGRRVRPRNTTSTYTHPQPPLLSGASCAPLRYCASAPAWLVPLECCQWMPSQALCYLSMQFTTRYLSYPSCVPSVFTPPQGPPVVPATVPARPPADLAHLPETPFLASRRILFPQFCIIEFLDHTALAALACADRDHNRTAATYVRLPARRSCPFEFGAAQALARCLSVMTCLWPGAAKQTFLTVPLSPHAADYHRRQQLSASR